MTPLPPRRSRMASRRGGPGSEALSRGERRGPRRALHFRGAVPASEGARSRDARAPGDRFFATLFHELRGPLATVRNWLFILRHSPADGEQARHGLQVIERQVALLSRLVEDLLDVSRIREGKIHLERTTLDLAELARGAVEDHGAAFAARGVDLGAEISRERVWVRGDGARLTQVLGNLLQNAAKFTPRGGRVSLALEADAASSTARLRLRDTGPGFEPHAGRGLFKPFEQVEATVARSDGGLGLGLALVKGLVELHGGAVEAHSDGPGMGAEFVVRLPLAAAEGARRGTEGRPA